MRSVSRRRVYLHIGAPKTGTTYLQDRLTLNAKSLAAHGFVFPTKSPLVSPGLFQFRAALDLLDQDWGGPVGHANGQWAALVKKLQRSTKTSIVSHEILAPAPPSYVTKAMRDLKGLDVHIVYSARDLGRQVPAAWQESIKQGRKWSFERYLLRFEHRNPWFSQAFNLPKVLGTWGKELPPENIHVVTVPHARGEELWHRFCQVFGLDPAWAPEESTRRNASLGVAETGLVRQLNRRMDRQVRREASFDEMLRTMLAEDRLVQRESAPIVLPPRLHPWATAQSESWIEWIRTTGVDVVGDLADLYPDAPVPEDEWVNPDKIGPKKQLNAALDALASMTREAARRPAPEDAFMAKVRRATRPQEQ